jgi:hypothetical protein
MWRDVEGPDRSEMVIQYGAEKIRIACPITKARIQTHTLRICNTYCFSTATTVTRTSLNVTLQVHCLSLFNICPYPSHAVLASNPQWRLPVSRAAYDRDSFLFVLRRFITLVMKCRSHGLRAQSRYLTATSLVYALTTLDDVTHEAHTFQMPSYLSR